MSIHVHNIFNNILVFSLALASRDKHWQRKHHTLIFYTVTLTTTCNQIEILQINQMVKQQNIEENEKIETKSLAKESTGYYYL